MLAMFRQVNTFFFLFFFLSFNRSFEGDWTTWENLVERNYETLLNNPGLNQIQSDYFNGIEMIQKKTQLALDQGIGGVMIWEIGMK
jgi:hypothetical protein